MFLKASSLIILLIFASLILYPQATSIPAASGSGGGQPVPSGNGIVVNNSGSSLNRSLAEGQGITITNPDGVSGNPTISKTYLYPITLATATHQNLTAPSGPTTLYTSTEKGGIYVLASYFQITATETGCSFTVFGTYTYNGVSRNTNGISISATTIDTRGGAMGNWATTGSSSTLGSMDNGTNYTYTITATGCTGTGKADAYIALIKISGP